MTEENFDHNKFAAEIIMKATESAIATIGAPVRTKLRRTLQAISNAYAPFLEKTFKRVSTIRTFMKPTDSVDLLQHYVPVDLTDKEIDYDVNGIIDDLASGSFYIVSGLAGRGKSVLTRYIALSLYHSPRGRVPLFLELRNLNSLTSKNILQLIHSQYKGDSNIGLSDFKEALAKGYFVLVLDGFDEVSPEDRDSVEAQLIDISVTYDKASVIISGRPYDRYAAWERYKTFHLKPMSIGQTKQLIKNATYDEDVKKVFLKRLTPEFFKKHESFLNTPLLAIMLMLTFEEYAEIPVSLHEFYRNAFDTLIRRHDAMKAQFLRKTHSDCTAEEFKKLFSSFCLLTYSKSVFAFHKDELIDYLKTALRQQQLRYSPDKVLNDLIESICLLQEEGFEISFVHRSFQEYFCALFVSSAPSGLVNKYLDSGKFRTSDDVLPLLYGMVPERVEEEWAINAVSDICDRYLDNDPDCSWKFCMDLYPEIQIMLTPEGVGPIVLHEGDLSKKIAIIRRMYPAHFVVAANSPKAVKSAVNEWTVRMNDEVKLLEKEGDLQFKGITKSIDDNGGNRSYTIKLNPSHKNLITKLYVNDMLPRLSALRNISKDQKARSKGSDNFLKEVFSA